MVEAFTINNIGPLSFPVSSADKNHSLCKLRSPICSFKIPKHRDTGERVDCRALSTEVLVTPWWRSSGEIVEFCQNYFLAPLGAVVVSCMSKIAALWSMKQ